VRHLREAIRMQGAMESINSQSSCHILAEGFTMGLDPPNQLEFTMAKVYGHAHGALFNCQDH
jgi:predicted pyridoxine 5'-phosphate oxidase superfamily flavin-nucleotide-binding protein